jgi:ABC-2 type transport system permease protein
LEDKIDQDVITRVKNPVSMKRLDYSPESGELREVNADIKNLILPLISAILLIIGIVSSSGYLVNSIAEEKENRVIEILLSSVTHKELLVGKIVGLGTVGLLQMMIWVSLIIVGAVVYIAVYMKPSLLVLIFVYYILGYLLYASIMAGIGSISESVQEGQKITGIFTLIALLPLFFIQTLIASPNSTVAIFLSMFPLTSAVSMMSRIAVTNVPFYQMVISIAILLISVYLEIVLFSRILRVEFLMYGKKPNINELIRYFFIK